MTEPWKVQAVKADPEQPQPGHLLISCLTSQAAWRRLSKPARAAMEQAYRGEEMTAHPNTMHALERHGFVEFDYSAQQYVVTTVAREVMRWTVKP